MTSGEKLVFREYPRTFWLVGIATVIIGNWVSESVTEHIVFSVLGGLLFGFSSILSVTVDRSRAVLNLRYRSLLRRSIKTFRFEEICSVNVAEDWEGEGMYRIELILCSGKRVPLRSDYWSWRRPKARKAEKLRSAIGLGAGEVRQTS